MRWVLSRGGGTCHSIRTIPTAGPNIYAPCSTYIFMAASCNPKPQATHKHTHTGTHSHTHTYTWSHTVSYRAGTPRAIHLKEQEQGAYFKHGFLISSKCILFVFYTLATRFTYTCIHRGIAKLTYRSLS